jgi:hypothetical protein
MKIKRTLEFDFPENIYLKSANGTTWYLRYLSQYMDRYALQAVLRKNKITSTQVT